MSLVKALARLFCGVMILNCHLCFSEGISVSDKLEYSLIQRDVLRIIAKLNFSNIDQLHQCIQRSEFQPPGPVKFDSINTRGLVSTRGLPCSTLIEQFIFRRTPSQYKEMRRALIFSKASVRTDQPLAMVRSGQVGQFLNYKPSHPAENFISDLKIPFGAIVPLSQTSPEAKSYEEELLRKFQESCRRFYVQLRARSSGVLATPPEREFCDGMFQAQSNLISVLQYQSSFEDHLKMDLEKMYSEARAMYKKLIDINPLLVFLSSPYPSHDELFRAIDFIRHSARLRLAKIDDYENAKEISKKVSDYRAGQLSQPDLEALLDVLMDYTSVRFAHTYTDSVIESREEKNLLASPLAEVKAALLSDIRKKEYWKLGGELALALAANGLCLTVKRAVFLKCYFSIAIPGNSYFVGQSFLEYDNALVEVFSHLESQHKLTTLAEADEKYVSFVLTSLAAVGFSGLDLFKGVRMVPGK